MIIWSRIQTRKNKYKRNKYNKWKRQPSQLWRPRADTMIKLSLLDFIKRRSIRNPVSNMLGSSPPLLPFHRFLEPTASAPAKETDAPIPVICCSSTAMEGQNDNGYDGFETRPGPIQFCSNWTQSLHDNENIFSPNVWWLNHMIWLSNQLLLMVCWWLNPQKNTKKFAFQIKVRTARFSKVFRTNKRRAKGLTCGFFPIKAFGGPCRENKVWIQSDKRFALSYCTCFFHILKLGWICCFWKRMLRLIPRNI